MPEDFKIITSITGGETESDVYLSVDKNIMTKVVHMFLDNVEQLTGGSDTEAEGSLRITAFKGVTYNPSGETPEDYRLAGVSDRVVVYEEDVTLTIPSSPDMYLVSYDLSTAEWVLTEFDVVVFEVHFEATSGEEFSFQTRGVLVGN